MPNTQPTDKGSMTLYDALKRITSEIDWVLVLAGLFYIFHGKDYPEPPSQWFGAILIIIGFRGYKREV